MKPGNLNIQVVPVSLDTMIWVFQMKKFLVIAILFYSVHFVLAQPTAGTSGLFNCPTADIYPDGTFSAGINYLPDILTPQPEFNYNTFNYYLGMVFLPFMELSYRMTLLENRSDEFKNQQDRSLALRVRIIKEGKWVPSIVAGGNDILTTAPRHHTQHFISYYIAATKTLQSGKNIAKLSFGYAPEFFQDNYFTGFFGGIAFSPGLLRSLSINAEYDTQNFNAGLTLLLFRHIFLHAFAVNMEQIAGGIAFRLYPGGQRKKSPTFSYN